jgi:hypothetical protein
MLRPMVSRPVCLRIKHICGAYELIFFTVRQLQVCWCGALSLMRGRICRFPESQPKVKSLLSICTIYVLHIFKCIFINIYGSCQILLLVQFDCNCRRRLSYSLGSDWVEITVSVISCIAAYLYFIAEICLSSRYQAMTVFISHHVRILKRIIGK